MTKILPIRSRYVIKNRDFPVSSFEERSPVKDPIYIILGLTSSSFTLTIYSHVSLCGVCQLFYTHATVYSTTSPFLCLWCTMLVERRVRVIAECEKALAQRIRSGLFIRV